MKTGLMKKRDDDENTGEIDLTPMLDVVFILLIFFIVTSVFVTEAGIDVNKPDASTASPRSQDLILIAVSGDGQIWIDGEQIDARFIRSRFERRLAETPNASVVIQGDEAAENQYVMRILEAARDANIASVSISTEN
ncbi:ExbD/TolR family protein [Pseudohongiella sp.]|uniref:Biopolymer transport protein ExbD/TolR n=1 Tax=marine sediment metagenome TaxID=412755 RepID=A0A0F9W2F4_9ZZZZ|nr:biopolymer transporter ExbD [Pseudohongiella sp.]